MGYLTNFIVYTLAMVGIIVLAVLVYKTTTLPTKKGASKFLRVHDALSLGPRKTLYIVSAGEEKFLIAGDVDKTTLISRLNENKPEQISSKVESFKETLESIPTKKSYVDKSLVGIYRTQNKPYDSVLKNLAERIKG